MFMTEIRAELEFLSMVSCLKSVFTRVIEVEALRITHSELLLYAL